MREREEKVMENALKNPNCVKKRIVLKNPIFNIACTSINYLLLLSTEFLTGIV